MQIVEEYFKRHSLTGVPLLKHSKLGYVFLREPKDFGFEWTVVSIFWRPHDYHPGNYLIRFSRPVHDSYSIEFPVPMELLRPDIKVNWDSYEEFLYDWCRTCDKKHVIHRRKEVILVAWEMFVYSYDSYLDCNYRNLSGLLFDSLNFSSSVDSRFASYQNFMAYVDYKNNPFKHWKQLVNAYAKHYCYWLSELVQNGS